MGLFNNIGRTEISILLGQAAIIVFWGLFVDYGNFNNDHAERKYEAAASEEVVKHYPMY
jgi:hypothetical protein